MMIYPEIDAVGELVCCRSGSDYGRMLRSVPTGHSLLIAMPPDVPSWWDATAMAWVPKPEQPSERHVWDSGSKTWIDPRSPDEVRADLLADLRARRNAALSDSDVLALRALEPLLPKPLVEYRQALRDLPTAPNLDHLRWPTPPF